MLYRVDLKLGGVIESVECKAVFVARFGSFVVRGVGNMAYTLPTDKQVDVQVSYVDAGGNPVDLPQGNVKWETADVAILVATPDGTDDQKCTLVPAGPIGTSQVTCTGTNVSGTTVVAVLDVTVVAGDAVTGTIQPGTPVPKP